MDSVSRAATGSEASSDKKASDSEGETLVYPAVTAQPTPSATELQVAQAGQPAQEAIPGGDTIGPNPANRMIFAGRGKYQAYRQGNITWRMNTETGQTCVLFATVEEWKKPQVYRAGCGGR